MTAGDGLAAFAGALADGEFDRLGEFVSPQFFGYEPGPDEPTATERITSIVADLARAMPDLSITLDDVEAGGEAFTATLRLTGTHEQPLWGSPGSGSRIEWANPVTIRPIGDRFALRFDDVAFPDLVGLMRELGLANPPDQMDRPASSPVMVPEFILKLLLTGQAGDKECSHLDEIRVVEPSTHVCRQCFETGDIWPALRMCLVCGFVGCCDTSKNKHTLQHHEATGHPVYRSVRLDEAWVWCYEDAALFESRVLDRYR